MTHNPQKQFDFLRRDLTAEELEREREYQRANYFGTNLQKGKKKQSASNELTDQVIKHIKEIGGTARRVNSQGQWDPTKGQWRTGGMRRGFEDVDACLPYKVYEYTVGLKIAVEIKIGKDTQSEYQVKRQQELEAAGGIYIIASEIEKFKVDLKNILLCRYRNLQK